MVSEKQKRRQLEEEQNAEALKALEKRLAEQDEEKAELTRASAEEEERATNAREEREEIEASIRAGVSQ